jgi:hypothetical protein
MSNVRNTVIETLDSRGLAQYRSHAEPVIEALEAREESIKDGLTQYAQRRGLRPSEVDALFEQVGLTEPAPVVEPEAVTSGDGDLAAVLNKINDTLAGLTRFAERHGYRG